MIPINFTLKKETQTMSKNISPDELMNLFNTAQVNLVLEELINKGSKLNTIRDDLSAALTKYGIDASRFTELFTVHLGDDAKNYSFEHNCAAVFVNDLLLKEDFYQKGKDLINNIVDGPYSTEGFKRFSLSSDQLYAASQRSGMPVSKVSEEMNKLIADPKSYVWDAYRQQFKKLPTEFPFIRGDMERGILEYCQDGDMDYAFSALDQDIEENEIGLYADLLNTYSDMEKDEVSDELIELILKLHPTVYSYSPSLISLHSDPEKAEEIYNAAWEERPETTPAEKKTTSDVLGVKLYADSANTAGATAAQSSSSTSSGAGLFFAGMGICFALALGNFGLAQVAAAIVFALAGIALGVIGIIKIVR